MFANLGRRFGFADSLRAQVGGVTHCVTIVLNFAIALIITCRTAPAMPAELFPLAAYRIRKRLRDKSATKENLEFVFEILKRAEYSD
jgi:hypothetical protein